MSKRWAKSRGGALAQDTGQQVATQDYAGSAADLGSGIVGCMEPGRFRALLVGNWASG